MNNLKKLLLSTLLLSTLSFYGQRKPDHDKIKTLKVAYITEQLDLSSSEAEAFWPVYNEHEKKMHAFRKTEHTEIRAKLKSETPLSESEAEKLLDKWSKLEVEKNKEQQSFFAKIKKILSANKTILLIKSEEDFKRKLIKEYRSKKYGGGGH